MRIRRTDPGTCRQLPNSAGRIAAAAAIVLLLPTASARAQEFCANVRQALQHAASYFDALKTSPAEKLADGRRQFNARILFPSLASKDCVVHETDTGPEPNALYQCVGVFRTEAQARAAYQTHVARLRSCFPANAQPKSVANAGGAAFVFRLDPKLYIGAQLRLKHAGPVKGVVHFAVRKYR